MRVRAFWITVFFVALFAGASGAAGQVETKDKNGDGRPDTWVHSHNGSVFMKEYDRNFDGKPDFGVTVEGKRLKEKKYDNNFDGRYEKTAKF